MPYIDSVYYLEEYKGKPLEVPTDLDRLIQRASRQVQKMINHMITPESLDNANPLHQELIKQATAELVEHYDSNGLFTTKQPNGLNNVSVGSFSYTEDKDTTRSTEPVSESFIPDTVIDTLSGSGLLYAGLNTSAGYRY